MGVQELSHDSKWSSLQEKVESWLASVSFINANSSALWKRIEREYRRTKVNSKSITFVN